MTNKYIEQLKKDKARLQAFIVTTDNELKDLENKKNKVLDRKTKYQAEIEQIDEIIGT